MKNIGNYLVIQFIIFNKNIHYIIFLFVYFFNSDILRHHKVLEMLMQQLQSPSLTIVSNACGTIWNLSARNIRDQTTMINLGIVPMLRSLIHSKHKMIATGSSAALNNLMNAMPAYNAIQGMLILLILYNKYDKQQFYLDIRHTDTTIDNTLINSDSTHLNDFTENIKTDTDDDDEDDLKAAMYVIYILLVMFVH